MSSFPVSRPTRHQSPGGHHRVPARLPVSLLLLLLPLCVLWVPKAEAQNAVEPPTQEEMEAASTAPLFTDHQTLAITLEADFPTLKKEDREPDKETERPAKLSWVNPDGNADSLDIQIRTRGNFRLDRRNCEFPPLRINVKKKSTEGTLFQGQDKLKLVVTCKLGQSYWEQYVLLEYLVYRTLNVLTPRSFRVRLVRATYVDSTGEDDPFTRYAFLIEDDDVMAVRNGARKRDWPGGGQQLDPRSLDPHYAVLVDVFQYMMGNTDWSGAEMHNMELIQDPDGTPHTVPFDFDFSGMVNTRYATPAPELPIRTVRRRLFRGFCPEEVNRDRSVYREVFQLFLDKKEEIYRLWETQPGLEEDRREDSLEYLDEFYETLTDEDRLEYRIFRDCRSLRG